MNLIHGYGYNLCNAITFATGSLKRGSYESYVTNVQKNGTYTTHLKYLESIYILRKDVGVGVQKMAIFPYFMY